MPISLGWISTASSATAADLIANTRSLLLGTQRESLNRLQAGISDVDTTVPLTYDLQTVTRGAYLSIGLEVLYVWSVDTQAGTALVQRGMLGSTAAGHDAGAMVYVNPRFTDWEIFDALNTDLSDLSSPGVGLFHIRTLDLTAVSGRSGYDFPVTSDFISIADIRWQVPGTVTNEWREITDYQLSENLPTTTFPSGWAIFLTGPLPAAQQAIRVRYRAGFTRMTGLGDNVVATTGLPVTAIDLPPLGAAIRLMAAQPVPRSQYDAQGDTRRADEVRVGDVVQAAAALRAQRAERVAAESLRLTQQWPNLLRSRVNL